jgi:hypothetical protein
LSIQLVTNNKYARQVRSCAAGFIHLLCQEQLQKMQQAGIEPVALRFRCSALINWVKPVIDEQVFCDKFLCDKFYLPSARVYMQQIFLWQVFIWQVLFTGVNVSEKGVYRRHDKKIIIVRWPITSNAQITLTSFLCWPIQTNKTCTLTIFSMTSALVQKLAC